MVIFPKTEHRIFNTAFPDILVFIDILKVLQANEKNFFPHNQKLPGSKLLAS